MITTIKEFNENMREEIRISCACLAQIKIDGKYLLALNKSSLKKGESIYTPFGGALEYDNSAKDFLNSIVLKYERETPDLRLFMYKSNLKKFENWFYKKTQRETSIERELIEELVEETKVLPELNNNDIKSIYIKTVTETVPFNNITNYRYFEIFNVQLTQNNINIILNRLIKDNILYLATKEEILNEKTKTNIKIGTNSQAIL